MERSRSESAQASSVDIQEDADAHDIAINAFFVDSAIQEEQEQQQNASTSSATSKKVRKRVKASSASGTKYYDKSGSESTEDIAQRRKRKQKAQHYDYNCVSNFGTTSDTTIFGDRCILVGLNAEASLILAGKFRLQVLKGTLSILGSRISASTVQHNVYAPTCYPLPTLSAINDVFSVEGVPPSLAHNQVVVKLSQLNDGLQELGNAIPDFKHVFECPYEGSYDGWDVVEGMYPILESTPNVYAFLVPPSWTNAAKTITENSLHSAEPYIGIVKGWKNTGKSAFTRFLCNVLRSSHKRVAYLECDIGQSEFMPSGCVSLHLLDEYLLGPPFTHPRIPSKSHFIGELSPANDPFNYIDAVRDLINHYQTEIAHSLSDAGEYIPVPLVINTQGWVKGLGAEMLQGIFGAAGKFDLVEMSASVVSESAEEEDAQTRADDEETSIRIDAIATAENPMLVRYHSADYRNLMMTTYFHARIPVEGEVLWDFSRPLTHSVPLCVDYVNDLAYLCILDGEDVVYQHTLMAINATVVALVEGHADVQGSVGLVRRDDLIAHKGSKVLGYGLIRAIDSSINQLQILTPLNAAICKRVDVIAKGKVDLPVYASLDWTNDNIDYGNVPYVTNEAAVGEGAQKRKVRRDIQRKPANN